jgi:protease IV
MSTEKKRRSGCFWFFFVMLLLALSVSMLFNVILLAGTALSGEARLPVHSRGPIDEYPDLVERWSYGEGTTLVARIELTGIITRQSEGGWLLPAIDPVRAVIDRIRTATQDDTVRAILLEVDSPGGAVTPSDEIFHALQQFRASRPDRRIVVFTRDVAASGAYYAAMAGDWLIAEPTSLIGSIGVMIQSLNLHGLSQRIGVRDVTIKSGAQKDVLNPLRDPTETELAMLQDVIDDFYQRFVQHVQTARNLDDDAMITLADGRILAAADALEAGLIDEIGYWDDAMARTATLLDVPQIKVIRYEQKTDWTHWLLSAQRQPPIQLNLPDLQSPRLLYLWRP